MENFRENDGVKKSVINWYPGHMAKTKREIKEKIDLIDVVLEVIDSRIPMSSKNKAIEELTKNKPRILIMTKKDLCDIDITNKWKEYYISLGYKVLLIDLMKDNLNELLNIINDISMELNEKRKAKGMKSRRIRALVLGIPNVGKSTLINRLVKRKATQVGNKPGITKKLEWIRINQDIELLDTPGILWPKLNSDGDDVAYNLAATTAIKEEILDISDIATYIIKKMLKYYPKSLNLRYNISDEKDIIGILNLIGDKIGAKRNNEYDYDRIYLTILKDLREGYLGKVTFDRR